MPLESYTLFLCICSTNSTQNRRKFAGHSITFDGHAINNSLIMSILEDRVLSRVRDAIEGLDACCANLSASSVQVQQLLDTFILS